MSGNEERNSYAKILSCKYCFEKRKNNGKVMNNWTLYNYYGSKLGLLTWDDARNVYILRLKLLGRLGLNTLFLKHVDDIKSIRCDYCGARYHVVRANSTCETILELIDDKYLSGDFVIL